jgi:hypothetical protein
MSYKPYNSSENFYARFAFEYTSRARLVKWGLCDEMGVPVQRDGGTKCTDDETVRLDMTKQVDGQEKQTQKHGSSTSGDEDRGEADGDMECVPATENGGMQAKINVKRKRIPSKRADLHLEDADETPSKARYLSEKRRASLQPRK